MTTLHLTPIGEIRTPHTDPAAMPIQPAGAADIGGQIHIASQWADGLDDLDGFSHLMLIYYFHRAGPARMKVIPFLDTVARGVFATRAPLRPNPIGVSIVRWVKRRGAVVDFLGADMLDGTPLLDIKPYVPAFDAFPDARTGWLTQRAGIARTARSDDRFAAPSDPDGVA